ncbi:AtpZ/AtpI family protein [Candidatus Sulfidibacterium hydrothermale]|uniref:AtpZ/AtpI family protein n=1 Tax=Candidatus Sulfidibacterium hydrothermale TaxID=2875962 RepID=UPI001F0A2411|nr:AtpZ/AtpI family protein [Candidatus Sulfidibacterium hydrothermale]UBM62698.1 AtpZ/AtpI family protein [Candidatus Sulfidibacterium hydrothermale]
MKQKKDKKDALKAYAVYSALGMQMAVIVVAGAFGGRALDKWGQWHFPVFTVVLTLLSIVLSILYGMREFFKQDKKRDE